MALLNSKYRIWEPLLLSIMMVVGMFIGYNVFHNKEDLTLIHSENLDDGSEVKISGRLEEILRLVENSYVDDLNTDDLIKNTITDLVSNLDPHSSYITPEELEDYNQKMEGVYRGIGIESKFIDDTLYVIRVQNKSSGDLAGLHAGDRILFIDNDTISGADQSITSVKSLFNKAETDEIDVTILRGKDSIFTKEIALEEVVAHSASTHYTIDEKHGYLRIVRFSANTYDQFFKSLESISQSVGKDEFNLILDLRDNPGGFVPQTIRILSQLFQDKDQLLSFTQGENRTRQEYNSTGRNYYKIKDIVVLINENSASASEIIAGAIQDWDRGVIIGKSSYGKGLVQEIFPLKIGGALRLTVARYGTPSGRYIQIPYNFQNESTAQKDSVFVTKKLQRSLANNGGIHPDIEVEDNNIFGYDGQLVDYVAKEILSKNNKISLLEISNNSISLEEILDNYNPSNLPEGITEEDIRSELIYGWFGPSEYFRYQNQRDACMLKAIEILSSGSTVDRLASNEF